MNTVDFEKQTASALKDCPAGTTFLAAVSGGADSMAMLTALSAVVNKEQIFCLHVEHGLRPEEESSGDAEFVRHYCKKSGIRCCIVSIPRGKIVSFAQRNGTGVEAAARLFRHRALLKEALRQGNNTRILIAHTKDDALELALMRILRGAGSPGLAAMPVKKGRIIRPLLSISRADVIDYLSEKKISWREDSTNTDVVFLRNRIRQQLVPVLNDSFPSWKKGLACMGETQLLTAAFLVKEAQTRVCWKTRKSSAQKTENFPVFFTDAGNFFSQPQIIREEALFQGIDSYSKALMQKHRGKKHDSVKRSAVRRFCHGTAAAVDLGILRVRRKDGKIMLFPAHKGFSESGFSLLIKEPGLYNLNKISIAVQPFNENDGKTQRQFPGDFGFLTVLPMVFRPGYKDDFINNGGRKIKKRDLPEKKLISAVDRFGIAAFIGYNEFLSVREMFPDADSKQKYWVTIKYKI